MKITQRIVPCLWFDTQGEEAANFYVSIFKNSKITQISRYGKEGHDIHGKPEGAVLTVEFELDGQTFTALNGGPNFKFNEALSLQVYCDTQEEIDYYWDKLSADGDKNAQQCGWLKDRYGVSWQVAPQIVGEWLADSPNEKSERMVKAMFPMKKLDIAKLQAAYQG